jgi:pimeloyl-ACP methyl ester carboxylesterase
MRDIVFLPGLNCTGDLFFPQINTLSPLACCTVADHGTADNLPAIAANILKTMPDRFALVGLSMGGYIAYEMIRQQPERVTKLVLMDTRASEDTLEDKERRLKTIELAENGQFGRLHTILWPRLVHPNRQTDSILEGIVKKMMTDTGPEKFVLQQTAVMNRPDYQTLLSNISVKTLVIVGAQDAITPPENAKFLCNAISAAVYMEIPECGHLSSLEKPDDVSAALKNFLI